MKGRVLMYHLIASIILRFLTNIITQVINHAVTLSLTERRGLRLEGFSIILRREFLLFVVFKNAGNII